MDATGVVTRSQSSGKSRRQPVTPRKKRSVHDARAVQSQVNSAANSAINSPKGPSSPHSDPGQALMELEALAPRLEVLAGANQRLEPGSLFQTPASAARPPTIPQAPLEVPTAPAAPTSFHAQAPVAPPVPKARQNGTHHPGKKSPGERSEGARAGRNPSEDHPPRARAQRHQVDHYRSRL